MKGNFDKIFTKLAAGLKKSMDELPMVLGNEGQKYFTKQFLSQSWEGKKWREVNRRTPGTNEYKYPKKRKLSRRTSPILIGRTRRLKNAVATSFIKRNSPKIVWAIRGQVGRYAAPNNYGNRTIPARQFMAVSNKFEQELMKKAMVVVKKNIAQ